MTLRCMEYALSGCMPHGCGIQAYMDVFTASLRTHIRAPIKSPHLGIQAYTDVFTASRRTHTPPPKKAIHAPSPESATASPNKAAYLAAAFRAPS